MGYKQLWFFYCLLCNNFELQELFVTVCQLEDKTAPNFYGI